MSRAATTGRARQRRALVRRAGTWALLAGLVLAGALVPAAGGLAGATPVAATTPSLTLHARQISGKSPSIELVARLVTPAKASAATRRELRGATVTFAVHLEEFSGAPLLTLGATTANAAGDARLSYAPTFSGRQALVATATDAAGDTLATAATSYMATAAVHPLAASAEATRPDGTIGKVVVGVLLALVVLMWIILVTVVARVQRRPEATAL